MPMVSQITRAVNPIQHGYGVNQVVSSLKRFVFRAQLTHVTFKSKIQNVVFRKECGLKRVQTKVIGHSKKLVIFCIFLTPCPHNDYE